MPSLPFLHRYRDTIILGRKGRFIGFPHRRMNPKQRGEHLHVIGAPGMGKSKLLEQMCVQDIANGRGCGLIDPHSLLVDDLLRHLITLRVLDNPSIRDRLVYVDPARTDYVVPFNVLDTPGTPYDIAAAVLEAFRRAWPDSLREAPHFTNVITAALIVLIENKLTLIDMPLLLTNEDFRESCLQNVNDHSIIEYFHDRYDRWGKEAPMMRESTLNKIGAFSLNPRLKIMLGQPRNHLDFQSIMDENKILLVDLGRCDSETDRLIGSLIVTGFELAMRRRRKDHLWNLTIDEFAGYVANEGSTKTLAHVFSEGRKFKLAMTVAHQDLTQLSPRILGALRKTQKIIFGIARPDAEYFAKLIGRVDVEAIKRDPKTETQHEVFAPMAEQWEGWIDHLRFQKPRYATVASLNGKVTMLYTASIPEYQAESEAVEKMRIESLSRYGIPYHEAQSRIDSTLRSKQELVSVVPESEPVTGIRVRGENSV